MAKPKGYNQKNIETLYQKYKKEAALINKNRSAKISDQSITYILSEA